MSTKIVVELTPTESETLFRPVNGQGGFQSVIRALQNASASAPFVSNTFYLTPDLAGRVLRSSRSKTSGGYQKRLTPFVTALKATRKSLNARNANRS
jgi:hypothetical protein